MDNRITLFILCVVAGHANAEAPDCSRVGDRLEHMVQLDQEVREKWNLMNQTPDSSSAAKDVLMNRWKKIDEENLNSLKGILAACGWPKNAKDSHNAWLLT